jgi:hypothetical protein
VSLHLRVACKLARKPAKRGKEQRAEIEFSFCFVIAVGLAGHFLETTDGSRDGNAALFESDFEGVALFAFDVQVIKLGGNHHGHNFFTGFRFHTNADYRGGVSITEEAFVDFSFDEVFVVPKTIAVVEEVLDDKWVGASEGFLLFGHEEFPTEKEGDHGDDNADDENGIGAGASATGHSNEI